MYILLLFIPLFSSISAGLFGRHIGGYGAGVLTTSCIFLCFLISLFIFYEVGLCDSVCYVNLWEFINSGGLRIGMELMFDSVTSIMLIVVTSVSTLVHLYSTGYMSEDPHLPRFMSYLSLFTFAMLILVTGANLLVLFIGWEGVGICSYLLINFWYTRIQANKSAMKAMIVNRVGDLGLLLAMFVCYDLFKSIDYNVMFSLAPYLCDQEFILLG